MELQGSADCTSGRASQHTDHTGDAGRRASKVQSTLFLSYQCTVLTQRLKIKACDICRQKKIKCDESQPACRYCRRRKLSLSLQEGSSVSVRYPFQFKLPQPRFLFILANISIIYLELSVDATRHYISVLRSRRNYTMHSGRWMAD